MEALRKTWSTAAWMLLLAMWLGAGYFVLGWIGVAICAAIIVLTWD